MSATKKIGLYGTGVMDPAKTRDVVKKAAAHCEKNFSKTKAFNATIQSQPKPAKP